MVCIESGVQPAVACEAATDGDSEAACDGACDAAAVGAALAAVVGAVVGVLLAEQAAARTATRARALRPEVVRMGGCLSSEGGVPARKCTDSPRTSRSDAGRRSASLREAAGRWCTVVR